jgi:hypothetical protein
MDEKYYTPEIEEFHEGFVFEYNPAPSLSKEWVPVKISGLNWFPSERQLVELKIRVKYLDQADIEELGWKFKEMNVIVGTNIDSYIFTKGGFDLYFVKHKQTISIHDPHQLKVIGRLFHGTINNKSELKRLMKQLGI